MPQCKNPECRKELPEDKFACDEKCLRRYYELRNQPQKLTIEEDIWLGQGRRKRAMHTIMKLAKECCPVPYKKFACLVSYRTGLSLRKVTDDFLEILLEVGLLKNSDGILTLNEVEPQ